MWCCWETLGVSSLNDNSRCYSPIYCSNKGWQACEVLTIAMRTKQPFNNGKSVQTLLYLVLFTIMQGVIKNELQWGNQGSECLSDLLKGSQLLSGRVENQLWIGLTPKLWHFETSAHIAHCLNNSGIQKSTWQRHRWNSNTLVETPPKPSILCFHCSPE